MLGVEKHYFACANTSKGFVNYFDSNLAGLTKIYILKGGPGSGKSSLMKHVGQHFLKLGCNIELIHCSSDSDSLDGVIVRDLKVGIVDGTKPHVIEPNAPGAIEEYVNLGIAWNIKQLAQFTEPILKLTKEISECYPKAYEQFEKALMVHDDWEAIYIHNMNFVAANQLTEEVLNEVFEQVKEGKQTTVFHRFFGGLTATGPIDYVMSLTENMKQRYFVKGRPGSGKSTMLKKILRKAESLHLEVEVYHCSFDPNSLDMILLPQLSICIFDSTAPHEYEPSKESDRVIDLYQRAIRFGTDEENEFRLASIKERYKSVLNQGIRYLQKAQQLQDELETYYIKTTDYHIIDLIADDLINRIYQRIE